MSKPTLVVFPDLLKSHVDSYTRKDGTVVQAHDDKRVAAAPKPAAKRAIGDDVYFPHPDKPGKKAMGTVVSHTDDGKAVVKHEHSDRTFTHDHGDLKVFRSAQKKYEQSPEHTKKVAEQFRQEVANYTASQKDAKKPEASTPPSAPAKAEPKKAAEKPETPAPRSVPDHHLDLMSDSLANDENATDDELVEHFKSEGVHPAHAKAAVSHRSKFFTAGIAHHGMLKELMTDSGQHTEEKKPEPRLALPVKKPAAPAKTGSAAPAKTVNAGTDKYPMHVKSSEKLTAKHDDGSTHHVGGFESPSNGKGDHTIHHDGKPFSFTGKSGKNTKTGEASYEYAHHGDNMEHRAWVTHSGHLMND